MAKSQLMHEVRRQGWSEPSWNHHRALPTVSIEDFFDDNDDADSIAVNLEPHPGLAALRAELLAIRAEFDVADVVLEIHDIEDALEEESCWPYAGRVYVATSKPRNEVEVMAARLGADGVFEGFAADAPEFAARIPAGHRVWGITWD